jgi:hypothetical protein
LWAETARTKMPLNPDPDPDGSVRLRDSRAVIGEKFATVLKGDELLAARSVGEDLYLPHFATCPAARKHRRR